MAEDILDPKGGSPCLDKKTVLSRMIGELPEKPWAGIEIVDWLPGDDRLPVEYRFADTAFGQVLAANTPKGICYLGLVTDKPETVLNDFNRRFRYTIREEKKSLQQQKALDFLKGRRDESVKFHLRGTPYQTEIWRRLICIPSGKVVSYATLGGNAACSRAAGTANGRNPIFRIVPCHRVVNTSGAFDRYFWGAEVKKQLLAYEFQDNF